MKTFPDPMSVHFHFRGSSLPDAFKALIQSSIAGFSWIAEAHCVVNTLTLRWPLWFVRSSLYLPAAVMFNSVHLYIKMLLYCTAEYFFCIGPPPVSCNSENTKLMLIFGFIILAHTHTFDSYTVSFYSITHYTNFSTER